MLMLMPLMPAYASAIIADFLRHFRYYAHAIADISITLDFDAVFYIRVSLRHDIFASLLCHMLADATRCF